MLQNASKFTNYTGGGLCSEWKNRLGFSRKLNGFTMVEMLMVMGIMGFLVVILSQVFGSILTMKLRSQATSAVAQDSRYLITRLSYDISRASAITVPNSTTMVLTISGTAYTYTLSGSTLTLAVGGGASQVLNGVGTKITALSFTKLTDLGSKSNVQISLTITPTIIQPGGATGARQLTTTLATR